MPVTAAMRLTVLVPMVLIWAGVSGGPVHPALDPRGRKTSITPDTRELASAMPQRLDQLESALFETADKAEALKDSNGQSHQLLQSEIDAEHETVLHLQAELDKHMKLEKKEHEERLLEEKRHRMAEEELLLEAQNAKRTAAEATLLMQKLNNQQELMMARFDELATSVMSGNGGTDDPAETPRLHSGPSAGKKKGNGARRKLHVDMIDEEVAEYKKRTNEEKAMHYTDGFSDYDYERQWRDISRRARRKVTYTGSGVGKTRLCSSVTQNTVPEYEDQSGFVCDAHFCITIGDGVVTQSVNPYLREECDDFGMYQRIVDGNGVRTCPMFAEDVANLGDAISSVTNWNYDDPDPLNQDGCTNNATISPSHICDRLSCTEYSKDNIVTGDWTRAYDPENCVLSADGTWDTQACRAFDTNTNNAQGLYVEDLGHPNSSFIIAEINRLWVSEGGVSINIDWTTLVSACEYRTDISTISENYNGAGSYRERDPLTQCLSPESEDYQNSWLCPMSGIATNDDGGGGTIAKLYYQDAISDFTVCWGCGNGVRETVNDTTTDMKFDKMYLSLGLHYAYPRDGDPSQPGSQTGFTITDDDYLAHNLLLPYSEECDDGNFKSGDGCSGCNFEAGGDRDDYGVNEYNPNDPTANPFSYVVNTSVYGLPFPWACSCTPETYGPYFCPDLSCRVEEGWVCRENATSTSFCQRSFCGNGYVQNFGRRKIPGFPFYLEYENGEECDDGNNVDGDGCSADCRIELGWDCTEVDNYEYWQTAEYFQLTPEGARSICAELPRYETPVEEVIALIEWYNQTRHVSEWARADGVPAGADGWAEALNASAEIKPIKCQDLTNLPEMETERNENLVMCYEICNFTDATFECNRTDMLLIPVNVTAQCWEANSSLPEFFARQWEQTYGYEIDVQFFNFTEPNNRKFAQYWYFPRFQDSTQMDFYPYYTDLEHTALVLDYTWAEFDNSTGNMTVVFQIQHPNLVGETRSVLNDLQSGSFLYDWWTSVFPVGVELPEKDGVPCYFYEPLMDNVTAIETCTDPNITYRTYHQEWCDNCCQGNQTLFNSPDEPYYYSACDDFWYLINVGADDMEACWTNRSTHSLGGKFYEQSNCTVDVCNIWDYNYELDDVPPWCRYWMNYRHYCGRPWDEDASTPIFVVTYGGRGSTIDRGQTLGQASIGLPKDPCGYCRSDEDCPVWYGLECGTCLGCQGLYDTDRDECSCDAGWVVPGSNVHPEYYFNDTSSGVVHVTSIYMKYNNMGGYIPAYFSNLKKIKSLYLNGNNIEGFAEATLIEGRHPRETKYIEWPNFQDLRKFYMRNNMLQGTLPAGFKFLKSMQELYLDGNQLTDLVTGAFSDLAFDSIAGGEQYPVKCLCEPFTQTSSSTNSSCQDSEGQALDSLGGDCSFYTTEPYECGNAATNGFYDDDDFTAMDMCCACGGGHQYHDGICYELDNGATDPDGNDCRWYGINPGWCGMNDDGDFSANTMCCACGGGTPEAVRSKTAMCTVSLEILDMADNQVGGIMPYSLTCLPKLKYIDLRNNRINSFLSRNVLGAQSLDFYFTSNMEYVNLGNNLIADSWQDLDFYETFFGARLNDWYDRPTEVPTYQSSQPGFGRIVRPFADFVLTNLKTLVLSNNQLYGTLPDTIDKLVGIEDLFLDNNTIGGSIPMALSRLTTLRQLTLKDNEFIYEVPANIVDLASLELLDLSMNKIESLPEDLRGLDLLQTFDISENLLTTLPESLGIDLPMLRELDVQHNMLTVLPATIPNMDNLETLIANNNHLLLVGELPNFSTMESLLVLDLSNNLLTGTMTDNFGLERIRVLRFRNNKIQGSLPTSIGTATMLVELDFSENSLQTVPDTLQGLSGLQILALQNNEIQQTIPITIGYLRSLRTLSLQGNMFVGDIPSTFSQLISAETIDVSGNVLQGTIPNTIGATGSMTKLKEFKIGDASSTSNSQNAMTGSIPSELFMMPQVTSLDLWGNKFSGHLPSSYCEKRGDFFVNIADAGRFWCPFPCFETLPHTLLCQNCQGTSNDPLGFTPTCHADDDKCMTCANHGECYFNDVAVTPTDTTYGFCRDYTDVFTKPDGTRGYGNNGLFTGDLLDTLQCPSACSGHGTCEQSVLFLQCPCEDNEIIGPFDVPLNGPTGNDDSECRFDPSSVYYTDPVADSGMQPTMRAIAGDALRTTWNDWIETNYSMYQMPELLLPKYPYNALDNEGFVWRHNSDEQNDSPRCRRGVPRLNDVMYAEGADGFVNDGWQNGAPAVYPHYRYNGHNEILPAAWTSRFICDNASEVDKEYFECWHIKLQVSWCQCETDWGGGTCAINTLEQQTDTQVWISAGTDIQPTSIFMAAVISLMWFMR